jgi:hypothetical protein
LKGGSSLLSSAVQALAVREAEQQRLRRVDGALAARQRHEAVAAAAASRRAARRGAADVARRIVAAQAAELESALQAMQVERLDVPLPRQLCCPRSTKRMC